MDMSQRALGRQFVHYSDADLQPGDEVVPASERGHKSRWSDAPTYSPDHVYMASMDHDPVSYEHFGAHSYVVAPVGDVERDPEPGQQQSYRAARAKVKKVID